MPDFGATEAADAAMERVLNEVTAELSDPKLARQFELEAEMIEEGRHRYWDRVSRTRPGTDENGRFTEGEESRSPTAQCLLRMSLNPVKAGVEDFLAAAKTGKAGRRHAAVKHLELVEPETSAFIAVKTCLDAFSLNLGQGTLCIRIGRGIEDEVRLRRFEEQAAGLLHKIRERFCGRAYGVKSVERH